MIIPDHWLVRGAQSAIFYYISCAPCSDAASSRRRKKAAARDRKSREAELALRPHIYAHPAPTEVNEYWRQEEQLGPLSPRKRPRKNTRDSGGNSAGNGGSLTSFDDAKDGSAKQGSGETTSHHFGRRKYTRPDEETSWTTGQVPVPNRQEIGTDYRLLRVPPINDMHPPTISHRLKAEDRTWMKQPPPSSDFLNGKIAVSVVERAASRKTVNQPERPPTQMPPTIGEASVSAQNNAPETVSGNLNKIRNPEKDGLNVTLSRPDSAVSTGRRVRYRPVSSRLQMDSSTASSDADDEDHLPSRPQPVYRGDGAPIRQRSRRSQPVALLHQDLQIPGTNSTYTPGARSSALLPQSTNGENLSPKPSPRSAVSIESPSSSEDENLPLPRVRSSRNKAMPSNTISILPSNLIPNNHPKRHLEQVEKQTSLRPFRLLRTSRSHTDTDSHTTPSAEEVTEVIAGLRVRDVNSSVDLGTDVGRVLEWKQLSEKAAKEHMWLGPAPVRSEAGNVMEKRHSTDF